jgi:hypothetical protein
MPAAGQPGARATATNGDQLAGARLFVSDVNHVADDARVAFALADDAWERVVARVFGIPRENQSLLVKMLMTGAAATVAGGYVPRLPRRRPSRVDAAMGGSVLNAAVRGLAGAPSRNIPAAGVLIALAMLARSIRAAAAGSTRDVQWLAHGAEARYGHHSATSVAVERT